jgi:protein-disulfide isomerase
MDRAAFEQLVDAPATRERLLASKKEGIVNKVEATPTFFIDGRRFAGDLDIDELVDVLEEEHDRVTGVQYRHGETGRR